MKKAIAVLLSAMMLTAPAHASGIDLSGMSLAELTDLQHRVTLAMWETDEWEEVTVPVGVWAVGVDIPAGHWTVRCSKNATYNWASITYCEALDSTGKKADTHNGKKSWYTQIKVEGSSAAVDAVETDIDVKEGTYIIVEYGDVVFTPYTPQTLSFK
ncbi:MAG: hypothetical protein IJJ23_03680 [Clostridia bacterium]|nr:hypothetical protein [Clostridia bacterium]